MLKLFNLGGSGGGRVTVSPCRASSGDNGTCLAENECQRLGGAATGDCSGRRGVCCVCEYEEGMVVGMNANEVSLVCVFCECYRPFRVTVHMTPRRKIGHN